MKNKKFAILWLMLAAIVATGGLLQAGVATANSGSSLEYRIKAKDGSLIRKVTGDVTQDVNGVPASPVDSFIWNGDGIQSIRGSVRVELDPVANMGEIKAKWVDENGKWEYKQTVFVAPEHSPGLVVGPGAADTSLLPVGDPVTTNVYLHGDTTAGAPVLPTVFNYLTTWGMAEITLNGEPFVNPYSDDGSALWPAHTMLTEGVRNEDGQVLTTDGAIYNPSQSGNGVTSKDEMEFHLVFDAMGEAEGNIPPPAAFFYHVTFNDVDLEISGSD